MALAVLMVPLPLVLIEFVCGLLNPRLQRAVHLLFVTLLAALAVLPMLKGMIDTSAVLVISASLLVALLIATVYATQPAAYTLASWLAIAILLFPIYFLVLSPASALVFPKEVQQSNTGTASSDVKKLPIVLVVLDELPLSSLMTVDQQIDEVRYPNFARLASSSTWFRNATTVSAGTLRSLPSILTGVLPSTTNRLATYEEFPDNIFTLFSPAYRLNVFESVTSLCPQTLCDREKASQRGRLAALFIDVALIYPHIVLPATMVEGLPSISQNWGNFLSEKETTNETKEEKINWLKDIVGPWQSSTDSPAQFRAFGQSITTEPALNFIHLLLPHVPFRYLPSGKGYMNGLWARDSDTGKKGDKWVHEWAAARSFQQSLLQLAYMDKLLGEFLDTLENTGVFDDALIVLVSDHGASYRPGIPRRKLTRENARDLLPVIMLVKEPNQLEARITDRNVETIDILPTLAAVARIPTPSGVQGQSMLDSSLPEREKKFAYTQVLKKLMTFDSTIVDKIEATQYKYDMLGEGKDPITLVGLDLRKDLLWQSRADIESSDNDSIPVNLDFRRHYENVDLTQDSLPVRITGRIKSPTDPTKPYDIAVSINGTIAAVGRTYPIGGNAEFSVLIPEDTLQAGKNQVEVFVPPDKDLE